MLSIIWMEANFLETDKCLKDEVKSILGRGLGQSSHVEYRNMSRLTGPRSVDNSGLFFEAEFLYCTLSMEDVSAYLFTSNSQTFVEFGNSSTYQTYHCIFAVFAAVCSVWSLDLAGALLGCPRDINQLLVWVLLCHPQRLRQPATNSKLKHPQVYIKPK